MHGQRRTYQAGCRCLPCKAANARAEANRRAAHRQGRRPLGSKTSPVEAARLVRVLLRERYTRRQIAQALGLKSGRLRLHPEAITVAKYLRLKRFYRQAMGDDFTI